MFEFLGQLIVIVLCADFLTGFFHWLEDTYCRKDWLFFICNENIEHHQKPNEIATAGNFFSRNRSILPFFICGISVLYWSGFWHWQYVLCWTLASLGNEVHYWNHKRTKDLNGFQRFMSNSGLIQSRTQHNYHHSAPYDRCYCVLTSFTNAVLDRIYFWRFIESLVSSISAGIIQPQRTLKTRDGF